MKNVDQRYVELFCRISKMVKENNIKKGELERLITDCMRVANEDGLKGKDIMIKK